MNTEEIFDLMKIDGEISKRFMGVYPIGPIPHNLPIPCVIIVNLALDCSSFSKKTCGVL